MAKGHKDKVAVITGASNGIGQAFAKRLAEDGVHIAIADIAPPDQTVKMVEQAGRKVLACQCDVASEESVAAMAADVQKKFGRCDIVVNCAGIFPQLAFDQMKFADWRRLLAINLDSVFLVTSAFVPGMKERGWGRVVSMGSSTFGSVTTGFVHYVTSKGGIMGFTRALAGELGPHGITVNAIAPSLTRTPGALARKPRAGISNIDEEFELVAQSQAIRRVEMADDLVGAVSYLTSDDAAFVTGQMLNINGGRIFS
jgi:NAD(P)-dependent dehydrogenase (short-subunit alcohol dehydrogenase family)